VVGVKLGVGVSEGVGVSVALLVEETLLVVVGVWVFEKDTEGVWEGVCVPVPV